MNTGGNAAKNRWAIAAAVLFALMGAIILITGNAHGPGGLDPLQPIHARIVGTLMLFAGVWWAYALWRDKGRKN